MIIGVLCLASTACFESKIITSKVNPPDVQKSPRKMNGVLYALPRTIVRADVPVMRVEKEPGQFVEFIKCFYPNVSDDGYVKTSSVEFKLAADKIKFDTTSVPDTDEVYLIKTQGGMFETRSLEVALTENGVLTKVSAESTNETIDIVTGTIKAAAGIAAKASAVSLLSSGVEVAEFEKKLPFEQRQCWNTLEESFQKQLKDAQATVTQKFPGADAAEQERRKEALIDKVLLAKRSDFFQAQEAFEQIQKLEAQRTNLFQATNIPVDTLKLMIEEIDKAIDTAKQSFFFGTKDSLTWTPAFKLNPTPAKQNIDLFTFSKVNGVCRIIANEPPYNQGVPFDGRFKSDSGCAEPTTLTLSVQEGEIGQGGTDNNNQVSQIVKNLTNNGYLSQSGSRGFYYRVPARAVAFVKKGDTELGRSVVSIAQYGVVVSVPASTGGRKTKYALDLYESSGGLKNFVMGSDSLVKQKNIDDIAEATGTAIDAKGERKKAKAPADELDQLERQRKILEERKKIRDLNKDLENTSPTNP
jgi:hypothetical protein